MYFVLIFTVVTTLTDAARILGFFPTPSISHQMAFRPLTQALAKRGHEVIVVTTDPAFPKGKTPANLTEIDIHDGSYKIWKNGVQRNVAGRSDDVFSQVNELLTMSTSIFEHQLRNIEIQDILTKQNDSFDLILIENCFRQAWVVTHIVKAPTIFVSSMGALHRVYETMGAPTHPLLYPVMFRQKLYNLTLWEKVKEIYYNYYFEWFCDSFIENEDELNRKHFGPDIPSQTELIKNMDMLFLNVHPIWDGNRPVPPNIVLLGGIHLKPEKELPQGLKMYLDSSTNGVIYVSFGTNVMPSMLPWEKIQILLNVFSKLPYNILWKCDEVELPGRSKNIRIEKWLPQSDLLRHPKVKLFITQGGLQSTDEAIVAGVPLIGVPLFFDQWYNVEHYVLYKIGVKVDMETSTEEIFLDAIETVLGDESYRQNIIHLRNVMYDQPQSPLDRAVWWAEHVIRHKGANHLKSPAANLTWAQYYELELLITVFLALLSLLLLLVFLFYFMLKIVPRKFSVVKLKNS